MQFTKYKSVYHRLRRQLLSRPAITRIILVLTTFMVLFGIITVFRGQFSKINSGLETVAGKPLPQTAGQTNFILLGAKGEGHEGSDLTDTVIFASVNHSSQSLALITVPRDLWIPTLRAKINTAYHYGYEKQATAGGLLLAKSAISEVFDQPVHFAVLIDFSTFARVIDLLGGIDITVDKTFEDFQYPISGKENDLCDGDPQYACRYEYLKFEAGLQHFDGNTALKYVRSRHSADPDEGTDFARSRRQAKVISAVKSKILSVKNLTNTKLYKDLYSLITSSLISDISPEYFSSLIRLGLKIKNQPINSLSIENYLENPKISSTYDSQWVLIPKNNDFKSLSASISALLK